MLPRTIQAPIVIHATPKATKNVFPSAKAIPKAINTGIIPMHPQPQFQSII